MVPLWYLATKGSNDRTATVSTHYGVSLSKRSLPSPFSYCHVSYLNWQRARRTMPLARLWICELDRAYYVGERGLSFLVLRIAARFARRLLQTAAPSLSVFNPLHRLVIFGIVALPNYCRAGTLAVDRGGGGLGPIATGGWCGIAVGLQRELLHVSFCWAHYILVRVALLRSV